MLIVLMKRVREEGDSGKGDDGGGNDDKGGRISMKVRKRERRYKDKL